MIERSNRKMDTWLKYRKNNKEKELKKHQKTERTVKHLNK